MCEEDTGERGERDETPPRTAVDALEHPVRRHVLEYLLEANDSESGMVLVINEVARFKAGSARETLDEITLGTVRDELEERHLPELERVGLLTHDGEGDRVALAEPLSEVRRHLELADSAASDASYK